ncbi:MAG: M28 family peptidase [Myxococcota bacterium]
MPRISALRVCALLAMVVGIWGCAIAPVPLEPSPQQTPKLLRGSHQLSFEGRRSGEGYFSRDGNQLIFQSEREPGNPFYQIYTLNLRTGASRLVSPGVGKSTCGFIHPGGRLALFSSTYLDPASLDEQTAEFERRAEGTDRRYAWDYDKHYDVFSVALDQPEERTPKRLTDALGYDAEASWSPNGREIVFASNRHAYEAGSSVETSHLEKDPARYVDLYIMNSSGRNVRRLTHSDGYDGGPFFSPDGERIIWRRFSPDGGRAEIYSMKKDGTDVLQLTHLDALSWAPFYHPTGEYVIFSTNLHGHDNFELYIVDARGEHSPVRVTNGPGFDGLPAFSPSGDTLVWTSNQTESRRSQLFRAEWNDALARSLLGLPPTRGPAAKPLLPLPEKLESRIEAADLRAHVEALTSPITSGRLTGTTGERVATSYVARAFRSVGLEPAGDGGAYFQSFGFTAGISLGAGNDIEVTGPNALSPSTYQVNVDWRPFAFSREGAVGPLEVVYAGYGIQAPEAEQQREIDDYAGLDVTGRWVLVFRYVPEGLEPESRQHLHRYSSLRHKAMVARDQGAQGLLVMSGPASKVREELAPLEFDVSLAGSSITALSISDSLAQQILEPSGWKLGPLQSEADADSAAPGFLIPGRKLSANVALERQRRTGRNVIGRLQMGPAPSSEVVVLGAHVDHLGFGGGSSSLATETKRGQVHPGADDNASGVAALLEIAQEQSDLLSKGELKADRDILFAAWSGEELGLLGSSYWAEHPPKSRPPTGTLSESVIAYLNFDMVGRLEQSVSIFGMGSSSVWPRELEAANISIGLPIRTQAESSLPTDTTVFYNREIPVLAAFTGAHTDYHTPDDTAEKLDFEGLSEIARLMGQIAVSLASQSNRPDFTPSSEGARAPARAHLRAYLGTVPDYSQSEVIGVPLSGVAAGGPAKRAGLRAGDVVIELAGRRIENIYDYTFAIEALAVGESVSVVVLRGGEARTFTVTPESRD